MRIPEVMVSLATLVNLVIVTQLGRWTSAREVDGTAVSWQIGLTLIPCSNCLGRLCAEISSILTDHSSADIINSLFWGTFSVSM